MRRFVVIAALMAIALIAARTLRRGERPATGAVTNPANDTVPARSIAEDRAWIEPDGRTCPIDHPVKVKLRSGIYHVPGGRSYERTVPDRCYRSPTAAENDGYRPAQA